MLKNFLKNALSSFVGAWFAIFLFLLGMGMLLLGIIGSMATKEMTRMSGHSVMRIVLSGSIIEAETEPQIDMMMLMTGQLDKPQTLQTLLNAIEIAKQNPNVEALFLECQGASASPATLNALRNGIKDFKSSGKRVFAYADNFTMGDYYVATIADEVYLNPGGSLNLQGLNGVSLYFKDLLDKIGIDVQTVRVGSFKSAVEPFTSNEMSEPARLQLDSLYTEMWDYILNGISKETNVPAANIDTLVNNFLFLDDAIKAKTTHLVKNTEYYWEVLKHISDYVGVERDKLNFVSPEIVAGKPNYNVNADHQIAVLYAVGEIGEFEGAGINCHKLVPLIIQLADNEKIDGMVLRVNSPGGSVFGSEQIGEALDYFQSKGKPLAVSMGDYAASGGYWISAGGDIIFADPLTITGSIGIFGMVPNIGKLANNIGVHPQLVGTNPNVLFPSIFYPMDEQQQAHLQANVERGYDKFITRVAQGRKKTPEYIKSIAEGRVWNAIKAQELGLVDQLGGLQEAINWVGGKIHEDNYTVVPYPVPQPTFWGMLMESSMGANTEVKEIVDKMSAPQFDEKIIMFTRWFLNLNQVQARSPYYQISL